MKLYVKLEPPYEWVRATGQNVEAFGEVTALAEYPLDDAEELIGVVPGEWVTAHRVTIPARTKKQFQSAVPYALEELVTEDVEDLHFVCPNWKAGEEAVVFVISKAKMLEWQALANANMLPLDRLVAEHSLLPFHEAAGCSLALREANSKAAQNFIAHHKNGVGLSIDAEFLDVWLLGVPLDEVIAVNDEETTQELIANNPDRDFRYWPFGNKPAHWLEHEISRKMDLFNDAFRPSVRKFAWGLFTIPATIIAVAIVAILGFDTYRYISLHAEIDSLLDKQELIVEELFPEIDYIDRDNARAMMEQAMRSLNGSSPQVTAQSILAEASKVLRKQKVTLSNLVYRNSELVITCLLNDFSQVDKITRNLNRNSRIVANLDSSASDDGQVLATYTIKSR